jgi:hypothetical protein
MPRDDGFYHVQPGSRNLYGVAIAAEATIEVGNVNRVHRFHKTLLHAHVESMGGLVVANVSMVGQRLLDSLHRTST